jgi:hypothetical protein
MPSTHGPVPSPTHCCEKRRKPSVRLAFQRWVRQRIELPNAESFEVWCARPTVKRHINNIYDKPQVGSRTQAIPPTPFLSQNWEMLREGAAASE